MEQESNHEVRHALKPGLLKEFGRDHDGKVLLWIGRILQGELGTKDDKGAHAIQTNEEWFKRRPHVAGNLALGRAVGCVEQRSVARVLVTHEFVRRTRQNVGKTKVVTEEFDQTGHVLQREWRTLLCRAGLFALGQDFTVVEIVRHHVQLLRQNHLCAREIEIPAQVINVLAVQMTKDEVEEDKGRHELTGNAAGESDEHGVRNDTIDELMNPLHTNRELQEKGAKEEGEQVTHGSVRQHIHHHTQGVAEEESQRVIERFHIKADAIRERLNVCSDKRRNCVLYCIVSCVRQTKG